MEEAAKEEEASTEEGGDDMDSNEPDADAEAASAAQVYLDLSIGIIMARHAWVCYMSYIQCYL